MMIEEETQVKKTAVYPQVHHLEQQLVFLFISLFCHPFFSHTLHPPTTSRNCSLSHLYLIIAESAAVNRPHHKTWVFICSEHNRAHFHAQAELTQAELTQAEKSH